jgi:hypothetical protein
MTTDTLRAELDASMTENEWMDQVAVFAHLKGWRIAHFRASRTAQGWRTAVAYDGQGWPDCVFVRERLVLAELKSETGKVTAEQTRWLAALETAGAESYLWRPSDWPEVERVLS